MYVMYVCRYTCVQVHCVWMHVGDACVQVHVGMSTHMCMMCVWVYVCVGTCVWWYMCVHVCMQVYACAGAYGGQMTTCVTPQELPILFLIQNLSLNPLG